MKIEIIKQFRYRGCPVLLRRVNKFSFEYLLLCKGKFYGTYIDDKLKWYEGYKKFVKEPHSQDKIKTMAHFLTKTAETTIETLLDKKDDDKIKNESDTGIKD